jgi:2-dehydro-3-deoxyphosphogalactonate aldolase
MLSSYLSPVPLIAILRGITPQEITQAGRVLYDAGFRCIEIPLNSPDPLVSIAALRAAVPDDCLIGAGTVLSPAQVLAVKEAGGKLIVMPHSDAEVIAAAIAAGMICAPGVATPTEAFAALRAGAHALKLFPAEQLPPAVLKAWKSVLPAQTMLIPVGGITPKRIVDYRNAGAHAYGLGSALYTAGMSMEELAQHAQDFVAAVGS